MTFDAEKLLRYLLRFQFCIWYQYNLLGQIFFLIHLPIDLDPNDIRSDFFNKSWYFRVKNVGAICFIENYLSEQFVPGTSLEATSFLV